MLNTYDDNLSESARQKLYSICRSRNYMLNVVSSIRSNKICTKQKFYFF